MDIMLCIPGRMAGKSRGQIEILKHRYPETYSKLESSFGVWTVSQPTGWEIRCSGLQASGKVFAAIISSVIGAAAGREPGRFGTVTGGNFPAERRKVGRNDPVLRKRKNIKTAAAGRLRKGVLLETISGDDMHRRITKNEIENIRKALSCSA